MQITDAQRRLLTEKLLGEEWHEKSVYKVGQWGPCTCATGREIHNRTFDNWEDFGVVWEAINAQGLWHDLYSYLTIIHFYMLSIPSFISGLNDPIRFPILVAEWMEKEGKK